MTVKPTALLRFLLPDRNPIRPTGLEIGAATALWDAREDAAFEVNWRERTLNGGRNSNLVPDVTIRFPDERRIRVGVSEVVVHSRTLLAEADAHHPTMTLLSRDKQEMDLGHSATLANAWRAVVATRLARALGMEHHAASVDPADPHALSDLVVEIVARNTPVPDDRTEWRHLPADLLIRTFDRHYSMRRGRSDVVANRRTTIALLSHPTFGLVLLEGVVVSEAMERKRMSCIEEAFGRDQDARPLRITGNARAARIIALADAAVRLDPEIADRSGGRIAPLVNEHVPRLLDAHAAAVRTATGKAVVEADDDLQTGLEIVRHAVEEALATGRDAARDALRTELNFLRLRHPDAAARREVGSGDGHGDAATKD